MEARLERKYNFLKNKYYTLLLPTVFMVMSEKIAILIDIIIIGFFLGSTQLSIINMISPLTYITGIFYILFGQGGNLLALRAQSELKYEKVNYYFTIAVVGIILLSLAYILLIFLFADNILIFFNCPPEIFKASKEYLLLVMFYYPLNCYILVISFFIRSDGFPKIPFYAVLLANSFNLIFDTIILKIFHLGITYTALGIVFGYLIGAIYISYYLFSNNCSYHLISLRKYKIKKIIYTIKEFIMNTPEVIGKIFFAFKISLLTYLSSTYWGVAGLLAFLIYDNSESLVYIFLSGIMKSMSPIVTVLYKEMDYEAVNYMIVKTMNHILLISLPVSIIFFIYPQILISLFNVENPYHVEVVTLAIRITAFSLVGRCMSYLLANYTQAIEKNRISTIITFLEEFLFIFGAAIILTRIVGGIGIWIAILIAECLPVVVYIILALRIQNKNKDIINRIFLIKNSKLISWTYNRNDIGNIEKYIDDESRKLLENIPNIFKENIHLISNSINDICKNIFENIDIENIDMTIRIIDEKLYIVFTNEGKLYNPFSNDNLIKSDNISQLSKLNFKLDYDEILGFNKTYIIYDNKKKLQFKRLNVTSH